MLFLLLFFLFFLSFRFFKVLLLGGNGQGIAQKWIVRIFLADPTPLVFLGSLGLRVSGF